MIFHINTNNTSYIIAVLPSGHLSCIHYGRRLAPRYDYSALIEKKDICYGDMVAYSRQDDALGLDDLALEYSTPGRGDFREVMLEAILPNGSGTIDLTFVSHEKLDAKSDIPFLPSSYDDDNASETHVFELMDSIAHIRVKLYLTAFYESDVIVKRAEIINENNAPITLTRAMSAQLDLFSCDYELLTFTGTWSNERQKQVKPLCTGTYINDTTQGASSSRANPFIMLKKHDADEFKGDAYGFNLVYSGNHAEIADVTHFGKTRILIGINPRTFTWELKSGETFYTPEAVLTFSHEGLNGVSRHMHRFVKNNIVRGEWKNRERPVLVNNWEGTWMDFDEHKLLSIARVGRKLGAELFVMDDGWFGARDSDKAGLGDWFVDTKKLPHGLSGLCEKIKALGMTFGVWVEPEMVNEDSVLYRAHPDWAVKLPDRTPACGRNQLILDLTRDDVRTYIIDAMTRVFSSADISYVKWDNNRNFSDMFTISLDAARQGEFFHRYMLGLYEVLDTLVKRFPHILFESCASGGNRFDLGMLAYMPQIWTSDNTDPISRLNIQCGTSYAYPQSVMGAHVSASPHHSTLRATPVETRFNVAAFGLLGYEMDLTELTPFDKKCITEQIAYYKAHRKLLQYGEFYRVATPFESNNPVFMVISEDKAEAIVGFFQKSAEAAHTQDILKLTAFNDDKLYSIEGRKQYISVKAFGSLVKHVMPVKLSGDGIPMTMIARRYLFPMTDESYIAGGDMLNYSGIKLKQQFGSTGYNENIRLLADNGSRLYYISVKQED